jgi:hypothetical protein
VPVRFGLLALRSSDLRAASGQTAAKRTRLRESLGAKGYKGGVGNLPAFIAFWIPKNYPSSSNFKPVLPLLVRPEAIGHKRLIFGDIPRVAETSLLIETIQS